MAASFPQLSQEPLEELINNLKVDDASTLVGSSSDVASCISLGDGDGDGEAGVNVKECDGDNESFTAVQTVLLMPNTPNAYYYRYMYPDFGVTFGGLEEHPCYISGDSRELHGPVAQADNGSLIYLMPGTQPGHNPCSHYVPVAMVGVDGHVSQPYPLNPMLQPYITSPGYVQIPILVQSPYLYSPSSFLGDGAYSICHNGMLESPGSNPILSSRSRIHATPSKKSYMNNQMKVVGKVGGDYRFAEFPSYSQGKGGYANAGYEAHAMNLSNNKPKARNQINNTSNFNLLNEPSTTDAKDSFILGGNAAGSLATGESGNSNNLTPVNRTDRYNLQDFPTKHKHAFFFVIKSYSEDDVHKSIKYSVWASTPNGNKRLDSAYQDAREKTAREGSNCPVFLFFSVNASGQFCGVAEMIGGVDFNKKMDFWQQDKWNGCFPVKWHIIKDVPNPQLRHIVLENNENKPVTNSRDTQEIRYAQGIEMLNIFKNYVSKTSILDDFEFYESRQKVMLEKRLRLSMSHLEHKQKTGEVITEEAIAN